MRKPKLFIQAFLWSLLLEGTPLLAVTAEEGNVYSVGWKIVGFLGGIAAIYIVGKIIYAAMDLEERGQMLKSALIGAAILACIGGITIFIFNLGDKNRTGVAGVKESLGKWR